MSYAYLLPYLLDNAIVAITPARIPLPQLASPPLHPYSDSHSNRTKKKKIGETTTICDPSLVHVAIILDVDYLCSSIVAVHSILHNSLFLENIFHFLVSDTNLQTLVESMREIVKREFGLTHHRRAGVLLRKLHEVINEIISIFNLVFSFQLLVLPHLYFLFPPLFLGFQMAAECACNALMSVVIFVLPGFGFCRFNYGYRGVVCVK